MLALREFVSTRSIHWGSLERKRLITFPPCTRVSTEYQLLPISSRFLHERERENGECVRTKIHSFQPSPFPGVADDAPSKSASSPAWVTSHIDQSIATSLETISTRDYMCAFIHGRVLLQSRTCLCCTDSIEYCAVIRHATLVVLRRGYPCDSRSPL